MLHILFIINPISGTGKKTAVLRAIDKYLDKERFAYNIRMTEYAGHASEIARQAVADGYKIIVAVGGDGTVNEVARMLIGTNVALGIIPRGSGNGLARHLHISTKPSEAVKILNYNVIHKLDYGLINDHPFFCTCGVGFDAFLSLKFSEDGKRGLKTYIKQTLKIGMTYKPEVYTIEDVNGRQQYKAFLIACANASQYGNDAYIAPEASMRDGLMDIVIMEPFSKLNAAKVVLQLFSKSLNDNTHIKTFKAKQIKITREHSGAAHFDGDPFETGNTINVELVNRGLNVVVNPNKHLVHISTAQILFDIIHQLFSFEDKAFRITKRIANI